MNGLSKELVVHVLKNHPDPDLAAELLEHYASLRRLTHERILAIEAVKKKAAKDIQKLCDEVICKHEITKNHGDPSGGSDSYEECLICGEEVPRKSVRFT